MRNLPLPKIQYDNNLSIIAPNDPVKNALIIGVKVNFIKICNVDENIISDGRGLLVNAKKLA